MANYKNVVWVECAIRRAENTGLVHFFNMTHAKLGVLRVKNMYCYLVLIIYLVSFDFPHCINISCWI